VIGIRGCLHELRGDIKEDGLQLFDGFLLCAGLVPEVLQLLDVRAGGVSFLAGSQKWEGSYPFPSPRESCDTETPWHPRHELKEMKPDAGSCLTSSAKP